MRALNAWEATICVCRDEICTSISNSNQIVFLTTRAMYVHISGKLVLWVRKKAVLAVEKCLLLVSSCALQLSETFHNVLSYCKDNDCMLFRWKCSHLLVPLFGRPCAVALCASVCYECSSCCDMFSNALTNTKPCPVYGVLQVWLNDVTILVREKTLCQGYFSRPIH